ncbi:hypothetical protein ABGB12_34320 [Actinocorallia sp. B10E7]|uniref:hypothetical protein n=1 Tax=Actinocorallia sp. B10E7 TaxID=3153558 RepID=UPI00325E7112
MITDLAELLAELEHSGTPYQVWIRLNTLLLDHLPPDDELVALVLDTEGDTFRSTTAVVEPASLAELREEARRLLAELSTPAASPIIERARERLLGEPARDAMPGDTTEPGLLLLNERDGTLRTPLFQFDADGRVLPVVREVNRLLHADEEAWSAADWWFGDNSLLDGVPAALLGHIDDHRLVTAARALRETI